MKNKEDCDTYERLALSSGDFLGWKSHAASCDECRERIRLIKVLGDDSEALPLRIDRKGIIELEKAILERPSHGRLTLIRFSYAAQIMVAVAVIIMIAVIFKPSSEKKRNNLNKELLAWDMRISSDVIERRIYNALKVKPSGNRELNAIERETNTLKRKIMELRKSIEKA